MTKKSFGKYGYFCPDDTKSAFHEVDAAYLSANGIRFLILDIDNTIEPYENTEPTKKAKDWFSMLKSEGVKAAFVSNNKKARVSLFNKDLGLPYIAGAGKPFPFSVKKAMKIMGAEKEHTLLLGDQIFTDVLAAHNAGIKAITVPPIKDKTDILTKTKRWLEKPIMKSYERKKSK